MSQPEHPDLGSVALFAGLPAAGLEEIRRAGTLKSLDKDEYLFFQGDPADAVFLILSGRIRLAQVTPEGQQVVLRILSPLSAFGHVALIPDRVFPVSAQAAEPSRLLRWSREVLLDLISRYPQIALNGMQELSGYTQQFQDLYREMVTERVERRIARTILRLAQQLGRKTEEGVLIDLSLSRQDLAEMAGTTLFTVSRILSQWEEQGLISSGRERIVVRIPHGLVAIAEDLPPPPPK